MSDLPDLYLPALMAGPLMDELEKRFVVHRDNPPPTTRAIVGAAACVVDQALLDRLPALEIVVGQRRRIRADRSRRGAARAACA